MAKVLKLITWAITIICLDAKPAKVERMLVSKMRMSDLETSASGFAYNQQQGLPASYVQYTNHGSKLYYDAPKPVHYVSPVAVPVAHPIAAAAAAAIQQRELANVVYPNLRPLPYSQHYIRPVTYEAPVVHFATPRKIDEVKSIEKLEPYKDQDFDDEDDHEDAREVDGEDFSDDSGELKDAAGRSQESDNYEETGVLVPDAGHGAAYVNDGGEIYDAGKYSAHGEKGETGYKTRHEFDKGDKKKYHGENYKGYYNDEGGQEKARSETEGHYAQHGEEEKGAKGANYGSNLHHKKGYKTHGFHNVYHKDEYKKDTDFYDENHEGGNYEKYGDNNQRHHRVEGALAKGDSHDHGYHRQEQGKQGHVEKGRDEQQRKAHESKRGDEAYQKKHADFAKNGGSSYAKGYQNH